MCAHKLPCALSLRLGMLWGSLWRKPLCTTGMTWICRTWWITFKKRCSGQLHFARMYVAVAFPCHTSCMSCVILAYVRVFHKGKHVTVPTLCGSPRAIPSAHTGTPLSLGFPMGEAQSGRMYCTWENKIMFLNIYLPLLSLFPSVQMLWVEQLHRLVLEPVL